ncbi:MAG: hypothetical protein IJX17_04265 [Clostridia bacterium]|nr:hypothetical protein [Clostridia bacterium]
MKKTSLLILRIVFIGIAAMSFIFGIVYCVAQMPIEGSIYKTNTSRPEREEIWEEEFERLYDLYDDENSDLSQYENKIQLSLSLELLYKYSFTDSNTSDGVKTLRLEIINNSKYSVMSMGSIIIETWDDEIAYSTKASDRILFSNASETYIFIVSDEFDIGEHSISATSVKYDNYTFKSWYITSYERELEVTKMNQITLRIYEEIGQRPTVEYENSDPMPDYLVVINENIYTVIGWFTFAVIFGILAFAVRKRKNKTLNNYSYASNNFDVKTDSTIVYETYEEDSLDELKEELKEEIIEEMNKNSVKKVVCTHCGTRYKDDLDECPNCGSTKIEN